MKGIFIALVAFVIACPCVFARQHFELKDGAWQQQKAGANISMAAAPQSPLAEVQNKLDNNQPEKAQELAEKWVKKNPKNKLAPQAQLLIGDSKVAQKYYYEALFNYEDIIRKFADSSLYMVALRREYKIADLFVHGTRRFFLGMRIIPAYADGEEILIRIQERAPGSAIGEKASMLLADYYYKHKYLHKAAIAYDSFIKNYPQSIQRKYALRQLIKSNLERFKGDEFDPTGLLNAKARAISFMKEYPAAAKQIGAKKLLKQINEDLGNVDLKTAKWYDHHGEYVCAALLYKRIVKDHPKTPAAKISAERLKKMDPIYTAGIPNHKNTK